jgi:hypothetical protein
LAAPSWRSTDGMRDAKTYVQVVSLALRKEFAPDAIVTKY